MRPKPLMATRVGMEAPWFEGGAANLRRGPRPPSAVSAHTRLRSSPRAPRAPHRWPAGSARLGSNRDQRTPMQRNSDHERRDDQRHDEDRAREHQHDDGQVLGDIAEDGWSCDADRRWRAWRPPGGVGTSSSLGAPERAAKRRDYAIESVERCRSRRRLSVRGARRSRDPRGRGPSKRRGGMVLGGQGAPVGARAQVSEDGEDLQLHAAQQQRGRRETQAAHLREPRRARRIAQLHGAIDVLGGQPAEPRREQPFAGSGEVLEQRVGVDGVRIGQVATGATARRGRPERRRRRSRS